MDRGTPEWFAEYPHERWSFSRFATYRRCPAWFRYLYVDWHKSWTTPILAAGHALQSALQKLFDGRPGDDVSLSTLRERATQRLMHLFDARWKAAQAAFEADPNGYGPWDLDADRYRAYAERGLAWHLEEVQARLERRHPRTGAALDLAPVTVVEAWNAVRPWHAIESADFDLAMERVPQGDFQGQYDLVYEWTGGRRIIDLKASRGESLFSQEIELQLAIYTWMELELGRGRPEGLEGWFLGAERPSVYEVPSEASARALGSEVRAAMERAWEAAELPPDEAWPPNPEVPEGRPARPGAVSAWCEYCPARFACPKSGTEGVAPGSGSVVEGVVAGIAAPRARSGGKVTQRFTLIHREGAISFSWDREQAQRLIDAGLRAGQHVRLSSLRPWRRPGSADVQWYPNGHAQLEILGAQR